MLTVRLPEDLKREIDRLAKAESKTRSDVVKEALTLLVRERQARGQPYELGADLFGVGERAPPSLAQNHKKKLKEKLREKHSY